MTSADNYFHYANQTLHAEQVPLHDIVEAVDTPCFVYSTESISSAYANIDRALSFAPHTIAYAVKANGNLSVLRHLGKLGAGADIVSGGELERSLKAGIHPDKIVFSGVGKTDEEIEAALRHKIHAIHIESAAEIDAVERIAKRLHVRSRIGLRVNPNIDADTHPYISTGLHSTKFGLEVDVAAGVLERILQSPHLELRTLACHIGSQLPSAAPLEEAVRIVASLAKEFCKAGAPIDTLDAGGGWPISYGDEAQAHDPIASYGRAIKQGIAAAGASSLNLHIEIEPGRSLVGASGVLLTRVIFLKKQGTKTFVVVDAAMTELLRPALYQAYHAVLPLKQRAQVSPQQVVDIVGPVCETADFFALNRELAEVRPGDVLAIANAGAYAACMASNYNARRKAPEVLVEGKHFKTVRKRESYEDLWRNEVL